MRKSPGTKKRKSLKSAIIALTLGLSVTSSILLGAVAAFLTERSARTVLEATLQETVQIAADEVTSQLRNYETLVESIGYRGTLADPDAPDAEKQAILENYIQSKGLTSCRLLDTNGISVYDQTDLSDRDYFQRAMQGEIAVSDPVISNITGDVTFIIAAPLWENGAYGTNVVGVITVAPPLEFLNDTMRNIKIGEGGSAWMLNANGDVIADTNADVVLKVNLQDPAQVNDSNRAQAALESRMITGESGVGDMLSYTGDPLTVAYAPIDGTNGWSLAIYAQESEFLSGVAVAIGMTVAIVAVLLLLSVLLSVRFSGHINTAIRTCVTRLQALARGDLHSEVVQTRQYSELEMLSAATQSIVNDLRTVISDEQRILGALAEGNFQIQTRAGAENSYAGDFAILLQSLTALRSRLNGTLVQIDRASYEVAQGADQVSAGAQTLSQGATEQASSVEELTATLDHVARQVQENAEHAKQSSDMAGAAERKIFDSKQQMDDLMSAIAEIEQASKEIGQIIKTIEDIAFQTNILALNAAVEAARAGQSGKGFAVVAEEVRSLAQKSADASKETAALVERSIRSVQRGTDMAHQTYQALDGIVEEAEQMSRLVRQIAQASQEQADALAQINVGVDQINAVVSNNSATAEQSAAASEEMNGQAQMLQHLISQFHLEQEDLPRGAQPPCPDTVLPEQPPRTQAAGADGAKY